MSGVKLETVLNNKVVNVTKVTTPAGWRAHSPGKSNGNRVEPSDDDLQ